jgi:hypothetical protein
MVRFRVAIRFLTQSSALLEVQPNSLFYNGIIVILGGKTRRHHEVPGNPALGAPGRADRNLL